MTQTVTDQLNRSEAITNPQELRPVVDEVLQTTSVLDMHTHLFAPQFGELNLWGVDELVTYHYLIAELFRSSDIQHEQFWALTKQEQADLIWETLFVRNTPLSEATRGVVAVLTALGLDAQAPDLQQAREYFRSGLSPEKYLDRVLQLSGVSEIVMTNDPFDDSEVRTWETNIAPDKRFHAALRLDPILNGWDKATSHLNAKGYKADADISERTITETRRFLDDWIKRMRPVYLAVSLPSDFAFPAQDSLRDRLIREVVLPTCREHRVSFALMIGVKRGVNPRLRIAGDGLGSSDVGSVERLCREYPDNRFLVTLLSRENQHQLCVAARKFSNLMPFGCWWFLNNPSIISEITRQRIELLGTSFIPQHSDARVLDQLIYKWRHSRRIIADALYESYAALMEDGRPLARQEVERDATKLFSGNFRRWVNLPVTEQNSK